MATEKTEVQKGEDLVRQRTLDILTDKGLLDPSKVDNDDAVMAAFNEGLEQINKEARALAADEGLDLETAARAGVFTEIAKGIDPEQFAAEVQRRAAETKTARETPRQDMPAPKTAAQFSDAGRAGADVLERVQKSGGLMNYIRSKRQLGLADIMAFNTADEKTRVVQRANDDLLLAAQLMGLGSEHYSIAEKAWVASPGRLEGFGDLACYKNFMDAFGTVTKAMDTTQGANWAPTVYSFDLIENVYQGTAVARLFPRAPWIGTGSTMTVPAEGTDLNLYGAAEPTTDDDDPNYTAGDAGLGTSVVCTAKTMAMRTVWSYEAEEDMIVNMLDHNRMKFMRAAQRDLDKALLDGDNDGTHQDTGASYTAQDAPSLFAGLRKKSLADATTLTDCSTYFNWQSLMTPALKMGAYAVGMEGAPNVGPASGGQRLTDTVLIMAHATKLCLTGLYDTKGNPVFLTPRFSGDVDGRGNGYGAVDTIGGFQIVPSEMVRSDLNTSGVYDNSTKTTTYAMFVYCPAWHIYDKALMNARVVDRPEKGQRVLVARMRLAFQHMQPSTAKTTGMAYKFVNTAFPS